MTTTLFHIRNYLKYLVYWRHRTGHGIHSPFIFDLVNRIFRNKSMPDIVSWIEKLRREMISDPRMLDVRDLGSGSVKGDKGLKSLKKIAEYSPVPGKYGLLLSKLASEFGNPYIVEFGTSLGISTMYMASGNSDTMIYTMEGSPQVSEVALENFRKGGFSNIKLLTGSFDDLLPTIMKLNDSPGLVFIDGNHRKEPVLRYFESMLIKSDERTLIVLDDIRHSREMEEAWEIIKKNENVSATVDIWRMGLVFLRKGVTRGHYKIRY